FLVLADVKLALWRNFVEATSAGIALNSYYTETVAGIFAHTVVSSQQTLINNGLCLAGNFLKVIFFLLGFLHDSVKFSTLQLQDPFLFFENLLCTFQHAFLYLYFICKFLRALI